MNLKDEFVRLLTVDSETKDRRKKEYNQAIFAPEAEDGFAIWDKTDLGMVLEKFDKAVRTVENTQEEKGNHRFVCEACGFFTNTLEHSQRCVQTYG